MPRIGGSELRLHHLVDKSTKISAGLQPNILLVSPHFIVGNEIKQPGGTSGFASEFFLQLGQRNLDHRRPSMRATVRQIAIQQIPNQFLNFGITQRIIGFDGMAANGSLRPIASPN